MPPKHLQIVEQQLPGEYEQPEQEYEARGLPDAWVYDNDEWSLLVESKVAAPLSLEQLKRHYRTAQRRGFVHVTVLVIDVTTPTKKLPDYVSIRTWKEIYSWLSRQSITSEWANRALRYMEVAERKWPVDGYLREGTLTQFSGIHFDENNPYNYGEAKRLLRLIMEELRKRDELKAFVNLKAPGRGAITGKGRDHVWDYLRLKGLGATEKHTKHPHLSVTLARDTMSVFLMIPSSSESRFRRSIVHLGEEGFFEVMNTVNRNFTSVLRSVRGASPYASVAQRHFASRSSAAIVDGVMKFDLRTAYHGGKDQKVKIQGEWLSALYSLIEGKKSNMDFGVGVMFPYESCRNVKSDTILDSISMTWRSCKPLLNVMPRR